MLFGVVLSLLFAFAQARHFPYIIGGEDVDPVGKWPFMVSLWNTGPFGSHFCGASLISSRWIVTASHCVDGQSPNGILALVGAHDFSDVTVGEPEFYTLNNIIMHEDYSPYFLTNDIALIQLEDDVQFNDYVGTVEMAEPSDGDFAGIDCYIIGWGGDKFPGGSSYPDILQESEVPAVSNSDCIKYYPDQINDGHICVGLRLESGACYGDSGGPLVCPDEKGNYVLAGATSFGPAWCPPTKPSVYTRISYFREWIRDNSGV